MVLAFHRRGRMRPHGFAGAQTRPRFSAVRWGVARRIVWAWIFTIPASALLAALAALLVRASPLAVALAILILGLGLLVTFVRWTGRRRASAKKHSEL